MNLSERKLDILVELEKIKDQNRVGSSVGYLAFTLGISHAQISDALEELLQDDKVGYHQIQWDILWYSKAMQ